jgi:multimeric flavodoxin WrbA
VPGDHEQPIGNEGVETVSDASTNPSAACVVGSPRAAGNTSYLVDVAIDESERRGARCEKLMLVDFRILPCEGHDDCAELPACPLADDMPLLLRKVYGADLVLLASPSYYEDVTGQMKVFIDRNCHNYNHEVWLKARAVGLIAVAESTGLGRVVETLRRYVAFSSDGRLKPLVACGLASRIGDAANNAKLSAAVRRLAAAMTESAG